MGPASTQEVLINAVVGVLVMPLFGLLGAVFLNWSQLLLESRPIRYWTAYKVTTLASMAAVVFLVPTGLMTHRLGSLGIAIDVALSAFLLGLFYARWITRDDDRQIGLGDGLWLSFMQSALWLLAIGVFFGLFSAFDPNKTIWGVGLAIGCTALLAGAAALSLRVPVKARKAVAQDITWKTEDILALYRHAAEEIEKGRRDQQLWTLATLARENPEERRNWYLAERVKQLRDLAEEQLRREGVI